ncbi:MAG: hypothetical protein IPJ84_18895 [Bdellovibrionales bacterium]|nr:hypothetical protein [Bdellovibrionales bacterium]
MSQIFPTWIYHESKSPEGLIVNSPAELAALGPGWVDTPAKFFQAVVEPQIESQELQAEDVSEMPEFKLDLDEPKKPKRSRK